jgi:intraflagellar transport protein 140
VLQQRIMLVERFVQARKMVKTDPAETVKICTQLLSSQSRIDNAIRIGDVFALLIEHYYKTREYQKAYALIQQMRDRNIIISPYLDKEMTDTIYREVGATAEMQGGAKDAGGAGDSGGDGEIGEEIGGEIDSDDLGRFSDGSGSEDDYMAQLAAKK